MNVCNCLNPRTRVSDFSSEKVCEICGHWWTAQHGSLPEAVGAVPVPTEPEKVPFTFRVAMPRAVERIGRNDYCGCGSGKKYKRCCLPKGGCS